MRRISRRLWLTLALGALLAAPLVAVNPSPSYAVALAPAADVQLVKAMMATGRLTFGASPPEARLQFEAYAAGFVRAGIVVGGVQRYCSLDHVILKGLYDVVVTRGLSIRITSMNRYCEQPNPPSYTSYHWVNGGGHAVDVDKVNGQTVTSGSAQANAYIKAMMAVMPAHDVGLGQLPCWPGITLAPGWFAVPDNCLAVHIEYRGTDTKWVPKFRADYDYDGDGEADFLAVRNDGYLFLETGDGADTPTFTSHQVAIGWATIYEVMHGDFDNDGEGDLMATDAAGSLWFYPGNGAGGFGVKKKVGSGWQSISLVTGGADFNGDGTVDLVARKGDGTLWLYKGAGDGGFSSSQQIGTGWGSMRSLIVGDFNGDSKADIEAVDGAGTLWFYPGNGVGGFGARQNVGAGWDTAVDLMTGGADFNGDGKADIIARRTNDNTLILYRGNGVGGFLTGIQIDVGWAPFTKLI